jgi:hypothetical protein
MFSITNLGLQPSKSFVETPSAKKDTCETVLPGTDTSRRRTKAESFGD